MNAGITTLRRRWLTLGAAAILLAVALTAGTLFAANELQQPESQPQPQQSVVDVVDTGLAPDLPAAPPVPERALAQQDDNDEDEVDLPPIVKQPLQYPNLDSNLNRLVEEAEAGTQPDAGQQPSATNSADGGATPAGEPVLVTFYIEPEQVAAVRQFLEDNGVFIRNVGEDWIEAHVPPALLPAASERPGVRRVDTVIPPEPQSLGDVVSQGVALHQADAWHRQGYRGQGVKVGIIDRGFEGFSQRQGDELPRNVTVRCYFKEARAPSSRLTDCEVDGDHGTAVAETLGDVAPEVVLYIANPVSEGDLRDAAYWMAEQGVQVINMSLSWIVDGPADGMSPFSDSPLKTIDAAVSSGIAWVNSGGNSARNVWYGTFSDTDGDGSHNFTPRDEGNTFFLPFDADDARASRVSAFMRWDDSWGGADCDLDLVLNRTIQGRVYEIAIDERPQSGGSNHIPFAWVIFEAASENDEGNYWLSMRRRACANSPAWIQLTAWIADDLEHYSPGHHIGNPAESRNQGMLAVGATHWWDTEYIADYSSRGPTIDGRVKPDITGIACGRTSQERSTPGSACWFSGTSQAAPHVAGLAALVKQRFPDYTPEQATAYLKQNATERGTAGADNLWGHGFATLPTANTLAEPGIPTVVATSNAGELRATWSTTAGAQFYVVGWANRDEVSQMIAAGRDWLDAFHYATIPAGYTDHTITGINPSTEYAVIIGAKTTRFGGAEPIWSQWAFATTARQN